MESPLLDAVLPPAAAAAVEVAAMAVLPSGNLAAATGTTATASACDASPSLSNAERPIPHVNVSPGHAVVAAAARPLLPADFSAAAEATAPVCDRPSSTTLANLGSAVDAVPTSHEAVTGDWGLPRSTSGGATTNPPITAVSTFCVPQGSAGAFLP
jgi:hypothetical protein